MRNPVLQFTRWRCALPLLGLLLLHTTQLIAEDDKAELPISQIRCESLPDDSETNADGSVAWIPTHRIKPATYHKLTTRYTAHGNAVTLDYLLYEPAAKPRGLIVLLTGGAFDASLKSKDGKLVNHSGANFLIRSAHYFAARGYRVIGMSRPDDYRHYGSIDAIPELYDSYRVSMAHAVDIAMLIRQHHFADTPVLLVGSSRGVISVFAQQVLANSILLSSPVTSGDGTPLGSWPTTVRAAVRPTVILLHHDDACPASNPRNTIAFAQALYEYERRMTLLEISGGIRDEVSDDPCAALDHHGFAGVEGCAINVGIDAVETLLAKTPAGNHRPMARDESLAVPAQTLQFIVHASDADSEDVLRYVLPTNRTVLDGHITLDSHSGKVTYQRPANLHGVTDRFVYSVSDGEGGISFGIISLLLN